MNNVTVERVKDGIYAVKYWGNLIGYVKRQRSGWTDTKSDLVSKTRKGAVDNLWRKVGQS